MRSKAGSRLLHPMCMRLAARCAWFQPVTRCWVLWQAGFITSAFAELPGDLRNMSQLLLDERYTKSKHVTCSNWEAERLTQKQVRCVAELPLEKCTGGLALLV